MEREKGGKVWRQRQGKTGTGRATAVDGRKTERDLGDAELSEHAHRAAHQVGKLLGHTCRIIEHSVQWLGVQWASPRKYFDVV